MNSEIRAIEAEERRRTAWLKLVSGAVGAFAIIGLFLDVYITSKVLTSAQNTETLVEQGADGLVRSACNSEGFKLYPSALQDPAELAKLIEYNKACAAANGLPPAPKIVLPPPR